MLLILQSQERIVLKLGYSIKNLHNNNQQTSGLCSTSSLAFSTIHIPENIFYTDVHDTIHGENRMFGR